MMEKTDVKSLSWQVSSDFDENGSEAFSKQNENQENDEKSQVESLEDLSIELESCVSFDENQENDEKGQVESIENLSIELDSCLSFDENQVNLHSQVELEKTLEEIQNGSNVIQWFDRLIPVKKHPEILLDEDLVDEKTSDFRIIGFEALTILCLSIAILTQMALILFSSSKGPRVVVPNIPVEKMKFRFEHLAVIDSNQTVWDISLHPSISPSSHSMVMLIPFQSNLHSLALVIFWLFQKVSSSLE